MVAFCAGPGLGGTSDVSSALKVYLFFQLFLQNFRVLPVTVAKRAEKIPKTITFANIFKKYLKTIPKRFKDVEVCTETDWMSVLEKHLKSLHFYKYALFVPCMRFSLITPHLN